MGTLLKCYRPFISSPLSVPNRTIHLRTLTKKRFSFFSTSNTRLSCFTALSSHSQSSSLNTTATTANNDSNLKSKSPNSELWLFNTMSRQKELFKPKVPGKVGMYVCGITSYDFSHIGHARAYVAFDVLLRYLKYLGYEVCYVRNFTDVDDKIIARANEVGEDPLNLSKRFCEEFHHDMAYLCCLAPSVEPCVSDHMPQIINMIKQIVDNGCAYSVDGDVYFSVEKFPEYGQLSKRKLEDNRAGERVAVDSRKRNPADFALWKELKNLRPQLYSAAEYCEKSYLHSEQKQMVLDNLKDYAVRALVNAVDHLGTVAYKLTDLFEQQTLEVSTMEVKASRLNQRLLTCRTYTDKEGLRQQQLISFIPRHHKHYILPNSVNKKVHFSPQRQTDARQKNLLAGSRLHPSATPAAKTLSWHLASETKSTVNVNQHASTSTSDQKVLGVNSGVFQLFAEEAVPTKSSFTHPQSATGTPNAVLQTFGVTRRDLESSKPLTAYKSFENPSSRAIVRVPPRSKSMLSVFFAKQKAKA